MLENSNTTRRSLLRRAAQVSAAAALAGPAALFMSGAEPTSCAGPKTPRPIKWTPDTNPILPRLPASTLSAADVTKLRSGYTALRKLTTTAPNDPRGWLQQGDKHCWNCGGGLNGQMGEEIHGSWLFFPWHRAYLYFHERILGTLINDKSLRLAYWDWDNAAHSAIPTAWVTPNNATNSLFDSNRSAVSGSTVPSSLVGPAIMNPILGAATFATIGGTATLPGNLENGPHGAVHIWCGNTTLASAKADMGLLDTAAQDPIFFAHHANIDRLWNVWVNSAPAHTNPTDAAWLTHRFTFWDEKARWVYITVADVINMSANLRYTYGTGLFKLPFPLTESKFQLLTRNSSQALVIPNDMKSRVMSATADPEARLTTLRIEGLMLPPNAQGIFRIVANKPSATAQEVVGTMNDLGYIAVVPRTSKDAGGHMHGALNVDLNVTAQLSQLLNQGNTLNLSFVPMAGEQKGTQLEYKNVYLGER